VFGAGEAAAVTIGGDARLTLPEFAAKTGEPSSTYEKRYAATGMMICAGVYSTAQLTIRNDLVTTAAHAFYDPDGKPRGDLSSCVFAINVEGVVHQLPLVASSLRVGSRNPYAVSPVYDWAVVQLAQPVPQARPYMLGKSVAEGAEIVLLAHRHRGWVHDGSKAIEGCRVRAERPTAGSDPREIGIDCSAGEGASGSAIMTPGDGGSIVGIYVGWRSTHPETAGPYSSTHMNFGIAIEGAFRNAVIAASSLPDPAQPIAAAAVQASTTR
jgi:hypothetical protein